MVSLPTFSVITACFNAVATLPDCLKSVHSQQGVQVEHIIQDGGSTDGTLEILRNSNFPLQLHVGPDSGFYDALNKGISRGTAPFVAILNADDLYANELVLANVAKAFAETGADVVYGDLLYVDRLNPEKAHRYWPAGPYRREAFRLGWMPPHPSFFLRREAYVQHGGYRLDMGSAADYELMLRMLYHYRLSATYLPQTLTLMRTGGASNASLKNRIAANRQDVRAWRVNDLKPPLGLALTKPLRKIGQFFNKGRAL